MRRTYSKYVVSAIVITAFSLVFGPAIYAQFIQTSPYGSSSGFGYGYGYGSSFGYGYGYGYGYSLGNPGDAESDYGFEGSDGSATIISSSADQTSFTVTYSTSYKAETNLLYGLSPITPTTLESTFVSGNRTVTVSGLECATTYSFLVQAYDVGGNLWSTSSQNITTSACSGGGVTVLIPVVNNGGGAGNGIVGPGGDVVNIRDQFFLKNIQKVGIKEFDAFRLQKFLNKHKIYVNLTGPGSIGKETSIFGPATRAALRKFQAANKITPVNGLLGPKTRKAINDIIEKGL